MASLADVTNQLKENNETQEFLLMENAVQLEDIREILSEISNNFARFYADYTEQITASLEAQAEAARQVEDAGGTVPTTETEDEKRLSIPILGLITSIAALSKMFDVDEFVRFPATIALLEKKFKPFAKAFDKITDVFTTIRIGILDKFGKLGAFFDDFIQGIGKVASKIGSFLKPLGTLVSKLALPIAAIFAVIDGISGFMKEFSETGSIVDGLRGAVEGIFDGLVGGLIRVISSGIEFLLDSLGFEDAAAGLGNLTDQLTEFLKTAVGGLFDALAGILTFDVDRIIQGLTNMLPERLQKVLGIGDGNDSDPAPELTPQQEAKVELSRTPGLARMLEEQGAEATREFINESYGGRKQEQMLELLDRASEPTAESQPEPVTATDPSQVSSTPTAPTTESVPTPPTTQATAEPTQSFTPTTEATVSSPPAEPQLSTEQEITELETMSVAAQQRIESGRTQIAEARQRGMPAEQIQRAEQKVARIEAQRTQIIQKIEKLKGSTSAATPAPNLALTAPVGQASKEVAAAASGPTIVAPQTTVAPTTNNSNVTNINNSTTVGSTSARPTEPSFMRVQEQSAAF